MSNSRFIAVSISLALLLSSSGVFCEAEDQDVLTQKAFSLIREGKYDEAKESIDELESINKTNPRLSLLKELLATETQQIAGVGDSAQILSSQKEKDQLSVLAAEGNLNGVQQLLDKGIAPNTKDQFGATALEHAAEAGHADIIKFLIGKGADVNLPDLQGNTPLMLASWNGHTEVVKILLGAGADANLRNGAGLTALAIAKGKNREEIAGLLQEKGGQE